MPPRSAMRLQIFIDDAWHILPGVRSMGRPRAREQVDTATGRWRELLQGGGVRSESIRLQGLMVDSPVLQAFFLAAMTDSVITARVIIDGEPETENGHPYQIAGLERFGDYNTAEGWSAQLEAFAAIAQSPEPPAPTPIYLVGVIAYGVGGVAVASDPGGLSYLSAVFITHGAASGNQQTTGGALFVSSPVSGRTAYRKSVVSSPIMKETE